MGTARRFALRRGPAPVSIELPKAVHGKSHPAATGKGLKSKIDSPVESGANGDVGRRAHARRRDGHNALERRMQRIGSLPPAF